MIRHIVFWKFRPDADPEPFLQALSALPEQIDWIRGMHVAQRFYARLIEEARARGFAEIRVDTHADNVRMQHVIASAGFTRAGTVCMDGNEADQRWAYQLFL